MRTMNQDIAAKRLAELGNVTRLCIFRLLVKAGTQGLTVGEIQSRLEIPGSTLSHHISRLMSADLVRQHREGRILHCVAELEAVEELASFLLSECCSLGQ
ncbi:MAG: ArsR/SmtB family transcription factor [Endozoicomonas sp.]